MAFLSKYAQALKLVLYNSLKVYYEALELKQIQRNGIIDNNYHLLDCLVFIRSIQEYMTS